MTTTSTVTTTITITRIDVHSCAQGVLVWVRY